MGASPEESCSPKDHMGDLIMVLLACTLANLRDRLCADGYEQVGAVVADLVEITNDYLDRLPRDREGSSR